MRLPWWWLITTTTGEACSFWLLSGAVCLGSIMQCMWPRPHWRFDCALSAIWLCVCNAGAVIEVVPVVRQLQVMTLIRVSTQEQLPRFKCPVTEEFYIAELCCTITRAASPTGAGLQTAQPTDQKSTAKSQYGSCNGQVAMLSLSAGSQPVSQPSIQHHQSWLLCTHPDVSGADANFLYVTHEGSGWPDLASLTQPCQMLPPSFSRQTALHIAAIGHL